MSLQKDSTKGYSRGLTSMHCWCYLSERRINMMVCCTGLALSWHTNTLLGIALFCLYADIHMLWMHPVHTFVVWWLLACQNNDYLDGYVFRKRWGVIERVSTWQMLWYVRVKSRSCVDNWLIWWFQSSESFLECFQNNLLVSILAHMEHILSGQRQWLGLHKFSLGIVDALGHSHAERLWRPLGITGQ